MGSLYRFYQPQWLSGEVEGRSFRSIFKWGDPKENATFSEGFFTMLKNRLGMRNEDFVPHNLGNELIDADNPTSLGVRALAALTKIVGIDNISTDVYERIKASHAKSIEEILALRQGKILALADVVVYPKSVLEIEATMRFCSERKVKVFVCGGRTNTVNSLSDNKGGVAIDLTKNFNKVVSFNEIDSTITVEAGMLGWQLEKILYNAPENFDVDKRYSSGHFPASAEYSSVGGWVSSASSGKSSAYHGDLNEIVVAQKYVTPKGVFDFGGKPKQSGVDLGKFFIGAEGAFGVLANITLKIFRYNDVKKSFCFLFTSMEDCQQATRDIMQAEAGYPTAMKILDANGTAIAFGLNSSYRKICMPYFKLRGRNYKNSCMLIGSVSASRTLASSTIKNIKKSSRKYHGMNIFGISAKAFGREAIDNPYLRDTLLDFGIITDFCSFAVNYSTLHLAYRTLREVCDSYKDVLYSIEIPNCYTFGATIKVQFFMREDGGSDYQEFKKHLTNCMQSCGAGLGANGGIGGYYTPWMAGSLGEGSVDILMCIKETLDPSGVVSGGFGSKRIETGELIKTENVLQANLLKRGVFVVVNKHKGAESIEIVDKSKNERLDITELAKMTESMSAEEVEKAVELSSKPEKVKLVEEKESKKPKRPTKAEREQRLETTITKLGKRDDIETAAKKTKLDVSHEAESAPKDKKRVEFVTSIPKKIIPKRDNKNKLE